MPQRDKSYDGASGLSVRAKGMTCEWAGGDAGATQLLYN